MLDYILNGAGFGSVAQRLLSTDFNPAVMRPWVFNGRSYITLPKRDPRSGEVCRNSDGTIKMYAQPVNNAAALLRKEEWLQYDTAIQRVVKPKLRIFGDLRAAGLSYTIPNGMGKTVLQYQTMGDITPATISMDGVRESESDRPEFDLRNLPLPITHKDFSLTLRELATSRNSGAPLDTTMAEMAARRVAEEVDSLTLGTTGTFSYGGGTIYGFTNFPQRNTYAMMIPTNPAWTPKTAVDQVIAMKAMATTDLYEGPYVLYVSPLWGAYLDADYPANNGTGTLRMRIMQINGISEIREISGLTGYRMMLVQLTSDVAQAVVGMDVTTLQWEEKGGMELHFKVMCIMVPRLRYDNKGNTGIVDAVAA